MPRYLVKYEDGSQEQYGAPGPDAPKIRQTVTAQLEKSKGKKIVSLQPVKLSASSDSKGKKKTDAKTKSVVGAKKQSKSTTDKKAATSNKISSNKKKSVGLVGKKIQTKKAVSPKSSGSGNKDTSSNALKAQLSSLENTFRYVVEELATQIQDLRSTILLTKKRELISQLDEIESQL